VGLMAKVCDYANKNLKAFGHAGYHMAVIPELMRMESPLTKLTVDGKVIQERFPFVSIMNTQCFGGAMKASPVATPFDGLLDIAALRDISVPRLIWLFPKVFTGNHLHIPEAFHMKAKKIKIELESASSPLVADGEVYGSTPVEIEVLPEAFNMFV